MTAIGPFKIKMEPTKSEDKINIIIVDGKFKYYFLEYIPEIIKMSDQTDTLLFSPNYLPESSGKGQIGGGDLLDYMSKSFCKKVVLSGQYTDSWKRLFGQNVNLIISQVKSQLAFNFIER